MTGGVLLYAINIYFTVALLQSIVGDIGGHQYYVCVTMAFIIAAIVTSLIVSRILQ